MSAGTVYENFFSKEKNSLFFSDSEPMFTSSEIFCQRCETRKLCIRGSFWGKTIFEIYIVFHTLFGLWSKKRLVGKRFFSRVVTTAIRASRDFFWEKVLFFKKSFVCSSVLEFEQFCLYTDKKQSGCQRNNLLIQKKVGRKKWWKNCFFKTFLDFEQKKIEQLDKRYSQDCQNSIQSVQRNNFRTFLWNEETLLEVFGRWAKLLNFWCEFWVKIPKTVAYGCSGTFWGSFGEKSNSLIVFGLRAKVTKFWQKNSAGC